MNKTLKKGQISAQFTWIFVFIVGAIMLVFFLTIVKSQTKEANYELAGEIVKNLDTVIKSSEQSLSSEKVVGLPDITINFVCDGKVSFYDIGDGITEDTPNDVIFSQGELRGRQLVIWTQSWKMPFRIATFQYLSTRNHKFVIVNDTGRYSEELYDLLPGNITKDLIEPNEDIMDDNYDSYRIVEFKGSEHTANVPSGTSNLTIEVKGVGLDSYGNLTFNNENKTNYLKQESLFGAIFSDGKVFYECTMDKAFNRMKTLMTLSLNRTENLSQEITRQSCNTSYDFVKDSINDDMLGDLDLSNSQRLYESSQRIKADNERLMRGETCPLIY